jgi:hypothetical protein
VSNKDAKHLIDNLRIERRLSYVQVKYYILRELNEKGLVNVEWINSEDNNIKILTKSQRLSFLLPIQDVL